MKLARGKRKEEKIENGIMERELGGMGGVECRKNRFVDIVNVVKI